LIVFPTNGSVPAMNTNRMLVVGAAAGLFVAGVFVGSFLNGGSDGRTRTVRTVEEARNEARSNTSALAAGEASSSTVPAQGGWSGQSLVAQCWTTLTMSDENSRRAEWLKLLPSISATDAEEIRELFRKRRAEGFEYGLEWSSFWPRWGEVGGAVALDYIAAHEPKDTHGELMQSVMEGWAKTNPDAARAWLEANRNAEFYEAALLGYIYGLARQDLARATADALATGKGRDLSTTSALLTARALQHGGLDGMMDWWRSLPDDPRGGSLRSAAARPVRAKLADANPRYEQAWLTELAPTPYRLDDRIGDFAATMATTDPAKAVAWVASLPPSQADGHYTGIGRSVKAWMAKDPVALDQWIAGLPASPLRDQAIAAKQPSVASNDVQTAASLFLRLRADDAKVKNQQVEVWEGLNTLEFNLKTAPQKP
jgi:hypothetical protein